jgi:radical SAM superfamily enzyme YgiQ (UPF0313 family)
MKILLISPYVDETKRRETGLLLPPLALYILEGLTSSEHKVKIVEEEIETINLDEDCDLVGISCMTANAPRAYFLAGEFRKRAKVVVMGGVHPTILPDEALQYADCVVIGEAEGVWGNLLNDFKNGCLQKTYHKPEPDLDSYIPKNYERVKKRKLYNLIPIITTRGCPYNCEFCSVTNIFGKKIRHIPVENVVRDIKESGGKSFVIYDDNITGHSKYARELFKAIKPLNIRWIGQATISAFKDTELLELAAESGCKALLFGLESISEPQMKTMRKSIKKIEQLRLALNKIMKMGILLHVSVIFGFDNDNRQVFEDTVKFLIKCKISTVSFCVLTPLPGTKTYDDLNVAGRLLTKEWKHYNNRTVVFKPKNMTPYELQLANFQAKRKFYRLASVLWRLSGNLNHFMLHLFTNYVYMKHINKEATSIAKLKIELFDKIQGSTRKSLQNIT